MLIEARAQPGDDPITNPARVADAFATELAAHAGVVAISETSWSARVTVAGAGPIDAVAQAGIVVGNARHAAGLPTWPRVHVEATRQDLLAIENAA